MTKVDRWLLPDGVDELLPEQAGKVEALRRKLLDLYDSWGYELVVPSLLEFTESLLVGSGSDVDLQTFKLTDQLSGRAMGIRADITPQIARIDAHSLKRQGPSRLCYVGSVLHARPVTPMASRSPIQLGAELYGDSGLGSDIEVISLMLHTLTVSGVKQITLDLGHVGIYRSLVEDAGIGQAAQNTLFDALQRKAPDDILAAVRGATENSAVADALLLLSQLNGDRRVLEQARHQFASAPAGVMSALDELDAVADAIVARMPDVELYFDLSELPGYHYHTGVVFAALAPGVGHPVANGGRYDHIGEAFGRARPATGFSTNLKALIRFFEQAERRGAILAPDTNDPDLWRHMSELRSCGERVITALPGQPAEDVDRQLVLREGQWVIESI